MNRPYSMAPGGGPPQAFQQLQSQSFGESSLANRQATPVGRSMYDSRRIAERAYRQQKNPRLLMNLQQQDFMRARDIDNFAQAQQLQTQSQQFQQAHWMQQMQNQQALEAARKQQQDARDAAQWQQQLAMYGLNQGAAAMEAERKRLQEEADRNRVPNIGSINIPGTGYAATFADGRFGGNVPVASPPPTIQMQPVPGTNQFVPFFDGKPISGMPVHTGEMVPGSYVRQSTQGMAQPPMQYTPMIPVPMETVRTNSLTGEQVTTRKQPAGSAPAPAPAVLPPLPAPAAASATAPGGMRGTTKGGYTWTLK